MHQHRPPSILEIPSGLLDNGYFPIICSLQVGGQPALEALPLILEPESRMYCSPVVVLDFQSLYPSLVIAYNLCYTTCLGRKQHASASKFIDHRGSSRFEKCITYLDLISENAQPTQFQ